MPGLDEVLGAVGSGRVKGAGVFFSSLGSDMGSEILMAA